MRKISRSYHSTLNELNITPLLDLVFVLLVIFIITTPQLMNNLEMNLPSGKLSPKKPDDQKPKPNKIEVDGRGQITLNGKGVTVAQLRDTLQRLRAGTPDLAVVVKGADEVDYQFMVNVLDVLRQLDITKVGLATEGSGP